MSRLSLLLSLAQALPFAVGAEVVHDGTDDWGLPPHPAVVNPALEQDAVLSLRGEWEFSPHQMFLPERNNHRVKFFYSREDWPDLRTIQVPGTWEAQGVGTNGFSECWDVRWDNSAKRIRHLHMGDGWYRKDVEIPADWNGRRIWLKVGGVRSIGWFWVNGHQVALSRKFCGTYKYDITPFVEAGKRARVVVQVNNAMPSRKGGAIGMHRWGGIYRDIELEATPQTLIDDCWVRGDFDRHVALAQVEIDEGTGNREQGTGRRVRVTVEGERVEKEVSSSSLALEIPLRNFRPWSPETPNLYTAKVELVAADGSVLQTRRERFGVRKIEVRGKELYLNGRPFYVRGFGDDSVYPMTGLPPADREYHRRHLAVAKASGFNFIRLHSHCEVPEYFEAADELGLLIQPELPYNSDVCCEFFEFDPMRDVKELYLNFRRHPSFGVYSMGNEGSFGKELDARLHAYVKSVDPDRLKINQDSQESWVNPPESADYLGGPISPWPRNSFSPDRPFVCHEFLNLGIKADSRDESLFSGVWEPPFPRAERAAWLARFGLGQDWGDRLQDAQHALQRHYQKAGLESARSDAQCDGYCFWTLIDVVVPLDCGVSGQGWMNAFWQPKRGGYGPSDFAVFNSPDCILVDLPDTNRVFVSGESLRADVLLAHYGERPLAAEELAWSLTTGDGKTVRGTLPTERPVCGPVRKIAALDIAVPPVDRPTKASLSVRLGTVANAWDVWVFPPRERRKLTGVVVANEFRQQLDRRYEGLLPESSLDAAELVIAPDGSALAAAAQAKGKRLLTLKGWNRAPNVKLGWWGMGPQVGTSFPRNSIYGDFPNEGFLTPLWFRLVKTGEKLPLKGISERDLLAVGEGGFACYAYVAQKDRTLMTFGLDLISETPEGACLLDGMIDELMKTQKETRTVTASPLNDGWTADGVPVTLPHCWNIEDGTDGPTDMKCWNHDSVAGTGYERKRVTYRRDLSDRDLTKGRYLRVNAASIHAVVRVDGREIGRHDGAFTAFTCELPRDGKTLEIVVDNFYDPDVPPICGDFTMYGGLYRGVDLLDAPEAFAPPVGLPQYEFREDGFYVNGVKTFLRGVCYHQDREGKGWAISAEDEEEDIRLIKAMGANAIRTSHYPRGERFYDLCDKYGIYVWTEIPLVDGTTESEAFRSNTLAVAREMVLQHRHHKCIAMWGIFNEVYLRELYLKKTKPAGQSEPLLREVKALIRSLDPRPVVAASCLPDQKELNAIPDALGLNMYPGWYGGKSTDLGRNIEVWRTMNERSCVAISEYGAGGSLGQTMPSPDYQPNPGGKCHPVDYQLKHHIASWKAIKANPRVWGSFAWVMFDAGSDNRHEGARDGINDKGLVGFDHKSVKPAYDFYKKEWATAGQ